MRRDESAPYGALYAAPYGGAMKSHWTNPLVSYNVVITLGVRNEVLRMKIAIRKMGNSQGVIIPKPVLTQLGLESEAEMSIERDAIVLRKPRKAVREGWAEASKAIAASGDDRLVWPEFGNAGDSEFAW